MIESRCSRLTRHLKAAFGNGDVLLVFAGRPIQKPGGLDQNYAFLPEPAYQWLSGSRRPGGALLYSNQTGWRHFVEPVSDMERMWEGQVEAPAGEPLAALAPVLDKLKPAIAVCVGSPDADLLTGPLAPVRRDPGLAAEAIRILDSERRIKDPTEIELISRVARIASVAYAHLESILRPGLTELDLQLEYEAAARRAGADGFPYDTIVGAGKRSAVLHALPTRRRIGPDELVLIDAGAEIQDYCVDITRVFHPSRRFNSRQADLIWIVRNAQLAAIATCKPGVEWHEVHRTAAVSIARDLVGLGLLRGEPQDLAETGVVAAFFPHGVGHMVGLRVRDVGGREPGRLDRLCCGTRVRVDLPLREGFVMTVEPGLYFIPDRLASYRRDSRLEAHFVWERIEPFLEVGGVRLEDDILVTADGPRVLTNETPHVSREAELSV